MYASGPRRGTQPARLRYQDTDNLPTWELIEEAARTAPSGPVSRVSRRRYTDHLMADLFPRRLLNGSSLALCSCSRAVSSGLGARMPLPEADTLLGCRGQTGRDGPAE
jgi:hypothetical protein